jgi:hypothetical protein
MLDFPLQDRIGLKANGVKITFFLQHSVQCRIGKGGIPTEELLDVEVTIPSDYRQEHAPPELRAGVIATPKHGSFQVAELIEQEQRMVAHAFEMPIVCRTLLVAISLAHRAIHIEDQFLQRLSLVDFVDPLAREVHQRRQVAPCAENLRLESTDAACRSGFLIRMRRPTAHHVTHGGVNR